MDHFTRYPQMQPFVGRNFHRRTQPSLLLVGESHYLPEGSTQHLTPERWYGGTHETLTDQERLWIDTPQVLDNACAENFANKAHWIWKNAFEVINDVGPRYAEARQVADDIAFVNFFLRPGREGASVAWDLTDQDIELANLAFAAHLERLAPTAVAFVSRVAHHHLRSSIALPPLNIVTPHPSSHWWNREAKRYGGKRGRDLLAEFVARLDWSAART